MRSGTRTWLWLALVLGTASASLALQRAPDKSEIELVVRGCLKGRELTADEVSGHAELEKEVGNIFRLSAKGDVNSEVKLHNGHRVEVTGLVKKTALATPGLKLGGGRIVIGGGPATTDPTRNPARNPQSRMIPMDVTSVELIAETCSPDL